MKKRDKMTKEQREEVFALWAKGGRRAVEHLAIRYDMSIDYIGRLCADCGYRRREQKIWKPQDVELAKRLLAERAKPEVFIAQLGRTRLAAKNKIDRDTKYVPLNPTVNKPIPNEVIEERNRRLMARGTMDLTAIICGDPPRGFSALDDRA